MTFGKWITHDDQKELFEVVFASVLNIGFLLVISFLLWSLGKTALAFRLAKGYVILWIAICLCAFVVHQVQRFFRVNLYDHGNAYVFSNLVVSCLLQLGWAAFAALTVHDFIPGSTVWLVVVFYLVGSLSCLVAYFSVSAFYQGHVYRLISLPVALLGFILFSVSAATRRRS